jgi:hypothetical protein
MNVFPWIIPADLAAMFAMAGVMKSTQPKEKLAPRLPWVEDFSAGRVRSGPFAVNQLRALGYEVTLNPVQTTAA